MTLTEIINKTRKYRRGILLLGPMVLIIFLSIFSNEIRDFFRFNNPETREFIVFVIPTITGGIHYLLFDDWKGTLIWIFGGIFSSIFLPDSSAFIFYFFFLILLHIISYSVSEKEEVRREAKLFIARNNVDIIKALKARQGCKFENDQIKDVLSLKGLKRTVYDLKFKDGNYSIRVSQIKNTESESIKLLYYTGNEHQGVILIDYTEKKFYYRNFTIKLSLGLITTIKKDLIEKLE